MNAIWFACRDVLSETDSNQGYLVSGGLGGDWRYPTIAQANKYVCEAEVTYENDRRTDDRTGVNGLSVGFCSVVSESWIDTWD